MQFYWFVIFWHLLFATHIHFSPYVWCSIKSKLAICGKMVIFMHRAVSMPFCQLWCAICTTHIYETRKMTKSNIIQASLDLKIIMSRWSIPHERLFTLKFTDSKNHRSFTVWCIVYLGLASMKTKHQNKQ